METKVIEALKRHVKNNYNNQTPNKLTLSDIRSVYCDAYNIADCISLNSTLSWSYGWNRNTWIAPPDCGYVGDLVIKAYQVSNINKVTVVSVIRSSTESRWWSEYCSKADVTFITGRMSHEIESEHYSRYGKTLTPAPSAIVVFRPDTNRKKPVTSYLDISKLYSY